jgi:hypothetical protein
MNAHLVKKALAVLIVLLLFGINMGIVKASSPAKPSATDLTVSGIISASGNPVAGVLVNVHWMGGEAAHVTGTTGTYSVSNIPSGSFVQISIRPPLAMRLEYRDFFLPELNNDLIKNFSLQSGHLLQGYLKQPDGEPYTSVPPEIKGLKHNLAPGEHLRLKPDSQGKFETVLPFGFYSIFYQPGSQIQYYMPPTVLDLSSGDITGKVITLLEHPVPIPKDPPVASLITVEEPDLEGYAAVTGLPGAVPPLAVVMVLNLNGSHLDATVSDSNGAFSAHLFAPPGSSLLVKYDIHGNRLIEMWEWSLNDDKETATSLPHLLPGMILYAGEKPSGGNGWQAFDYVGRAGWWSAWWVSGVIETSSVEGLRAVPGEIVSIDARVVATSPAMECTDIPDYTYNGAIHLKYLFAQNGRPLPQGMWFNSFLFTPTGMPIEHETPAQSITVGSFTLQNWQCLSQHAMEAHLIQSFTIPIDLPEGRYIPQLHLQVDIPKESDYPTILAWLHDSELANLPPLQIGDAAPPYIPWTLLVDYPVNGQRGVQAEQDYGIYALPHRVLSTPELVVIPRLDARTGEILTYRLDPGSYWLSGTDRRVGTPPKILFDSPAGEIGVQVLKPNGSVETLGPVLVQQSSVRTPSLVDGSEIDEGTGHIGDTYHLATLDERFDYSFTQSGLHRIHLEGQLHDIYGNIYPISRNFQVMVAHVLDLDPAQLPTTPYEVGDSFAPGLHIFPPVPADITISLSHLPYSDASQEVTFTVSGKANRFGYFQPLPGPGFQFEAPGEFRVDITAVFQGEDGEYWAGTARWGNVVASPNAPFEVHGRRALDYKSDTIIDTIPAWFTAETLPEEVLSTGLEGYYPYFSGDIVWDIEENPNTRGFSLHTILTLQDLTGPAENIYNILRQQYPRSRSGFRFPPLDNSMTGLEQRLGIGEAPLFITTSSGIDPAVNPADIDFLSYWYGSSQRPDVRVREIISVDSMGTAYWRYNDTYGHQLGEPADGDQPGDLKWNFGGVVFRVISDANPINLYGIYGSLWVLLPPDDPIGMRVTPPFQDALGGSINGGPIMTLDGTEIDMLFLPKGVRPGDILEIGDTISFSGHVGPPLDSRVDVTITSPSGKKHENSWHANKIGWIYDPSFDFTVQEAGLWTVNTTVTHDRVYRPLGFIPQRHNTGTVLGTQGQYHFYVVEPDTQRLYISSPSESVIDWPDKKVHPILIKGVTPIGTEFVHYTVHDKGIVMGQGSITPAPDGAFTLLYDPKTLNLTFPMVSLTAHEGRWEGLADEVSIHFLADGAGTRRAATVTLIGEQVYIFNETLEHPWKTLFLPIITIR